MALISLKFFCFISAVSSAVLGTTMESDQPWHIVIDIGMTAILPCAVESNFLTDPNQVVWNKIDSQGAEFKISTGSVLHEPYLSTLRFNIEQKVETGGQMRVTAMPLKIKDVQAADNGTYRCQVFTTSGNAITSNRILNIPVVLRKFSFTSESERINNRSRLTFVFEENVPQYVICHVTSINHRPALRILKGPENMTSEFISVVNSTTRGPPGLQEVVWDAYLLKPDLVLREKDNGKMLRCMSWFRNPFPKGTGRRAALQVVFKPKFMCKEQHWISPSEPDHALSCVIHANPRVDIQSIEWSVGQDSPVPIAIGRTIGDFSSYISVDPLQDARDVTVILLVRNVSQYVSRTCKLRARNSIGFSSMNITLTSVPETSSIVSTYFTSSTKSSQQNSFELALQSKDNLDISTSTSTASTLRSNHIIQCATKVAILVLLFNHVNLVLYV